MVYSHLASRRLLSITGADAESFLQGLFSCDVRPAFKGQAVYGALLSPQGKFLHDFFLYPAPGGVWLDADSARLPDLLARLKIYRLRSDVVLEVLPEEMGVVAAWEQDMAGAFADPRMPKLGLRAAGRTAELMELAAGGGKPVEEAEYHRMRLMHAVPDGTRDMVIDKSLLMEFGFERLHGVDFSKGCYVGQEVTARSKFRGQVRKGLYSVCIAGELPASGTPITFEGKEVGYLGSVSGGIGLCLLQAAAAEAATPDSSLMAGNTPINVAIPDWLRSPHED